MDRGFSIPFIPIILVIIGVCTYFFGWIVFVYVAVLFVLITAGTALYDKIVHDTRCRQCIQIKKTLSQQMKVDKDLIKTKHVKYYDTNMDIRVYLEQNKTILVNIGYGSEEFKIYD